MIVFISGSINAGKTTTGKLLAEKLGAEFLDFDSISENIPNFDLSTDLPKVFTTGIATLNEKTRQYTDMVVSYVIGRKDYERLTRELNDPHLHFFTLAPKIEVAQSNRGERTLTGWEKQRIQHHYDVGIASPDFGEVIDNSHISPEEVVDIIRKHVAER